MTVPKKRHAQQGMVARVTAVQLYQLVCQLEDFFRINFILIPLSGESPATGPQCRRQPASLPLGNRVLKPAYFWQDQKIFGGG